MPEAMITGILTAWREGGTFLVVAFLGLAALSAFMGDRRKVSAPPVERDPKHDENQGRLVNVETAIHALARNHERLHDAGMQEIRSDLEPMKRDIIAIKTILEIRR